jgi:hypothetical protein
MKQEFTWHALENAETPSRAACLMDLVTEYFAYVGIIGVAVCVAVMTLAFSAAVGVQLFDKVAKPGFFETEMQRAPPATKAPAVQPFRDDARAGTPSHERRCHLVELLTPLSVIAGSSPARTQGENVSR